jgi:hypothetical protein
MATFEELDKLSSQELHDRAMSRAEHHLDAKFFWELLEMVPVAEAAKGDTGEAEQDAASARSQLLDALAADRDHKLLDSLRPVYIDYLTKHNDG